MPGKSWGSEGIVKAWHEAGGFVGQNAHLWHYETAGMFEYIAALRSEVVQPT